MVQSLLGRGDGAARDGAVDGEALPGGAAEVCIVHSAGRGMSLHTLPTSATGHQ